MVSSVKIQWNKMPQTLNLGKVKAILAVIVIKLVTFKISNLRWDASHNKKLNNDETDFYCWPTFLLKFRSVCFFFPRCPQKLNILLSRLVVTKWRMVQWPGNVLSSLKGPVQKIVQ